MTFLVGDKIRTASSELSPLHKSHSKEENLPWGEERGHMVLCGTAFQIVVYFEVIFGGFYNLFQQCVLRKGYE